MHGQGGGKREPFEYRAKTFNKIDTLVFFPKFGKKWKNLVENCLKFPIRIQRLIQTHEKSSMDIRNHLNVENDEDVMIYRL